VTFGTSACKKGQKKPAQASNDAEEEGACEEIFHLSAPASRLSDCCSWDVAETIWSARPMAARKKQPLTPEPLEAPGALRGRPLLAAEPAKAPAVSRGSPLLVAEPAEAPAVTRDRPPLAAEPAEAPAAGRGSAWVPASAAEEEQEPSLPAARALARATSPAAERARARAP